MVRYRVGDMELKSSYYNIFFHLKPYGPWIGYNGLSGNFVEINDMDFSILEKILKNPNIKGISIKEKKVRSTLIKYGFLVSYNINEIESLKLKFQNPLNQCSAFFTIAITEECNFNCTYCFEKHGVQYMNDKVRTRVLSFIKKHIPKMKLLTIDWYGGEPLLRLDLLENLDTEIENACKEYQCEYSSSISTNGYLLNEKVIKRLIKTSVNSLRICLDGISEIHNNYRKLKGGAPTFNLIINNLLHASDNFNIKIRINIDKFNFKYFKELLNYLQDIGLSDKENVILGIKPIISSRIRPYSKAFNIREFSKVEPILLQQIVSSGFNIEYQPEKKCSYCIVFLPNQFMIDWRGFLYKCTDTFLPEEAIGKLTDSDNIFLDDTQQKMWTDYPPTYDKKCRKCIALPMCMGGCNFKRFISKDNYCAAERYNIEEYVKLRYESVKNKNVIYKL